MDRICHRHSIDLRPRIRICALTRGARKCADVGGKQNARTQMRRRWCRNYRQWDVQRQRRSTDHNDDDEDSMLSARRHAAYCLRRLQRSAKPVTCRASRDAPRVAPSEWSSRFADRPLLLLLLLAPFFFETKGRKGRKERYPRSGQTGEEHVLGYPALLAARDGVCAARESCP